MWVCADVECVKRKRESVGLGSLWEKEGGGVGKVTGGVGKDSTAVL